MTHNLENEIWLPIQGYEGLYEVSNMGRIKTLERTYYGGVVPVKIKTRLRKLVVSKKGYLSLLLSKDGIDKQFKVHRLVAEAFIPNIENKPQVNHKNGIKSDNRIENLEWATNKENCVHSWEVLNRASYLQPSGFDCKYSKPVFCETFGLTFGSTKKAAEYLGLNATRIGKVCKEILVHTHGLTFRYI